jgi:hypothetical protein
MKFRFETWDEYWWAFMEAYPASAMIIKSSSKPLIAPRAFRDNQPWNLRNKGGDSCLCQHCENCEKYGLARHWASSKLKTYLEEVVLKDDGLRDEDFIRKLQKLIDILKQTSKTNMCLKATCGPGEEGDGARLLSTRSYECLTGACNNCGINSLWNGEGGIRETLLERDGDFVCLREDIDPVWVKRVKWSRYAYRPKDNTRNKTTEEDDDDYGKKIKKELYIQPRAGTLIDFLDDFVLMLPKYISHRGILSHQKKSSQEFYQSRRPGMMCIDHDYAENMKLQAHANEVQSEYWGNKQCTVYNAIVSWLSKDEWDKEVGIIEVGEEVTVFGEKSGCDVNEESYWAKVIQKPESDDGDYVLQRDDGTEETLPRKVLRHRVVKKQAHVGVTGDNKHDTYSMRHFIIETVKNIKISGTFDSENFTVLCFHSDNAAQHFKSSNSINWLSQQLLSDTDIETLGFKSALWDFGAPGHGKGVWDGIGATIKQWMKRRITSELVSRDPAIPDEEVIDEGDISAKVCFDKWVGHFSSQAYEANALNENRITFRFHYSGPEDNSQIKRPKSEESFDRIDGIKSSYQFFMLRTGEVLARQRSCWCLGCLAVAMGGPGEDTKLTSSYEVGGIGCSKADSKFYEWSNKTCRCKVGSDIATRESTIKENGHTLAQEVEIGNWLLFEAFSDAEDELWLAKAVAFPSNPNKCVIKHTGPSRTINGTRFDGGDFKIAVQFYERSADCDDDRRTFVMGEPQVDILNSTELRASKFQMELLSYNMQQNADPAECTWKLPRRVEAAALQNCR